MADSQVRQRLASAYAELDRRNQEVFLTEVAYWLSFNARDTYRPGTDEVEDSERLRAFNEAVHRVLDQLRHVVTDSEHRYPDDVFANVLVDNVRAVKLDPISILQMLVNSNERPV